MANSKLLKEAIADAKAVKETAIANAKIALEEAFTPKLQSILSKKLQAEIAEEEDDKEEVEEVEETVDSSKIGAGDNKEPEYDEAHTELDPETEKETAEVGAEDGNLDKVDDLKEGEDEDESKEEVKEETEEVSEIAEEEEEVDEVAEGDDHDEEVDEELDLEAIIKELESDMEEELDDEEEGEVEDIAADAVDSHEKEKHSEVEEDSHEGEDEAPKDEMKDMEEEEEVDEDIDLDEILREMGYGEEEEVEEGDHEDMDETLAQKDAELKEAYKTIKSLKGTINEVNLLNAKLLFANKLFRSYNLTNEQKVKVVETLDRTNSVREVKLVFSTLAESLKFNGNSKKQKIQEGIASKASASTAPKKEIIEESTNEIANRFKKLANLI
tara:strand:- start:933 stop:2087 length:1155 start_codon:yes stop_codon:yes gene_type:complete